MSETKVVKSERGGRRPGAGRKLGSGKGLTAKLQICVTPVQAQTFKAIGSSRWLRRQLDREKELKAEQRGRSVLRLPLEAQFPQMLDDESSAEVTMQTPRRGRSSVVKGPVEHKSVNLMDMLVPAPEATIMLAAPDNGMKDAGISKDDLLIVDRSKEPRSGQVVLARVGEEFLVRRLVVAVIDVSLVPEHAGGKEEPRTLDELDDWQLIGVVTSVVKRLSA